MKKSDTDSQHRIAHGAVSPREAYSDHEALLRTPKPVKSIYCDFKYYFDEYSYANCDLYVEKAIEDCGNNTLRKEFLRAKGWDAPDDFDINDEEE